MQFPALAAAMEYAFGEFDVTRGGGGLEAHPHLTITVEGKTIDNCYMTA